MKRNPTRPGRSQAPAPPKLLMADLNKARSLMDRGRPTEALETLRALDQVYPNRTEVLLPLADVYFELHALPQYLAAVERLSRLEPNDPEITLALGGARLLNFRPVLALTTFRRFLARW